MQPDSVALHGALEAAWQRLIGALDGGSFERRGDLWIPVCPPTPAALEIGLLGGDELEATNRVLAAAFEAPKELFDLFSTLLVGLDGASIYVGRVDGDVVSTAVGFTVDGATGVFNVATPREHR